MRKKISTYPIYYILFFFLGINYFSIYAQESDNLAPQDSSSFVVSEDTTQQDKEFDRNSTISSTKSEMDEDVTYNAEDSIIMLSNGTVIMYNNAKVTYGDIKLEAYYIRMNRDSSMIYAEGIKDSTGQLTQTPKFSDGTQDFESETIRYNFITKKGLIYNVASEQAEGYITGGITKRVNDESFCMKNGRYTTCSNIEHPHFYLAMTKAKVHPGKSIVTGPAYLVMEGVKLPFFIPFGYFPFTDSYTSGFIMPSYGEESTRGFYLKNGGYYFALSDYMDLALTGDIYTQGSWAVYGKSNYRKRYKFSGNINATYRVSASGEEVLGTSTKSKDFSIRWTHTQDPKASPYSNFSASVNFSSSSYETNDLERIYDVSKTSSSNRKSSSISYSKRFPEAPFNLSLSATHSQNAADTSIAISLPQFSVTMNRIYPFKRKKAIGSERWYEKISMSYTGSTSNSFSGKQDKLYTSDLIKDWKNGIKHTIPVSTSFQLFNNITLSPTVNYTERWYSSSVTQKWDTSANSIAKDTTWGFNRVYDYSTSMSMSTKLYGMYYPIQKIFGSKVQAIRHVMTPSVSLSWRPDFSDEHYGYYDTYKKYNSTDSLWEDIEYSKYAGSLYGTPGSGKSSVVSFSLGNNLEMKVRDDKDSTADFKKVKLIDRLNFGTGYNIMADSLNWSNVSANLGLTVFKKSVNISATFDPYTSDENGNKINTSYYSDKGKLMRLTRASTSMGLTINQKKISDFIKKLSGDEIQSDNKDEEKKGNNKEKSASSNHYDNDGYLIFAMPWSLNFSYSVNLTNNWDSDLKDYKYEGNSNLSMSGNISLTEKWKFNFSSGYNFRSNTMASTRFSVTRDLHCWSMSASFVPIGTVKSYNISIHVNSSMLQDLKYDKRNSPYDNSLWDD